MSKHESASSRWERLLRRQACGDLSISEFCRREGVSAPSFYLWRRRLRGRASASPTFVELKAAEPSPPAPAPAPLELILANGHRVSVRRGFDPQALRELLTALAPPPEAAPEAAPEAVPEAETTP